MGDLLSLSDTARRLRGALSDTLTIGMGSGMAQIFIPRMFADLKTDLPGVRLDILTAPTKNISTNCTKRRSMSVLRSNRTRTDCRRDWCSTA